MAIILLDLLLRVRTNLSDVPLEKLSDEQVWEALTRANDYVLFLVPTETVTSKEAFVKSTIVVVASYYAYLTYTGFAEQELGNLAPTSVVRLNELRAQAFAFLHSISGVTIRPQDLSIDDEFINKTRPVAYALTKSAGKCRSVHYEQLWDGDGY